MKDRGLFIFSLLIAVMLSFFVSSQSNTTAISINVPIEVRNVPPSKIILLPVAPKAQVSIRGPAYLLSDVTKSPPVFSIKLENASENRVVVRLVPGMLELPSSVEITSIEPNEVEFILDQVIEKKIEVVVPKIGQVPKDVLLEEFTVTPSDVMISGPKAEIENISVIETDPIDLRDVRENFSKELLLRQKNSYSKLSHTLVTVAIKVSKLHKERVFPGLAVEIRNSTGRSFSVTPQSVNVEVTGPADAVAALKPGDVVPYVVVDQNLAAGGNAKVAVSAPKGISGVYVEPEKVKLIVSSK